MLASNIIMSNTNKDRGPGQRGGDNKPEKKNDLKIQLSNHNKMAAYTQKNTFSAATTLPPPDNRLYIASNINKNKPPLWIKNAPNDSMQGRSSFGEDTGMPDPSAFERDHFAKMQMAGIGDLNLSGNIQRDSSSTSAALKCQKCGIPGHFDFNCMNNLQFTSPATSGLAVVPPLLQTKELLEYNLQVLRLKQEEMKREKRLLKEEKRKKKDEKKKRKESKKDKKEKHDKKHKRDDSREARAENGHKQSEVQDRRKESKSRNKESKDVRKRKNSDTSVENRKKPSKSHHEVKSKAPQPRAPSHETSISSSSSVENSRSSSSSFSEVTPKTKSHHNHRKEDRRDRSRERSKERKDRKDRR